MQRKCQFISIKEYREVRKVFRKANISLWSLFFRKNSVFIDFRICLLLVSQAAQSDHSAKEVSKTIYKCFWKEQNYIYGCIVFVCVT